MKDIFDIFENSKAKDTNKRNNNKHSYTKIKQIIINTTQIKNKYYKFYYTILPNH